MMIFRLPIPQYGQPLRQEMTIVSDKNIVRGSLPTRDRKPLRVQGPSHPVTPRKSWVVSKAVAILLPRV